METLHPFLLSDFGTVGGRSAPVVFLIFLAHFLRRGPAGSFFMTGFGSTFGQKKPPSSHLNRNRIACAGIMTINIFSIGSRPLLLRQSLMLRPL